MTTFEKMALHKAREIADSIHVSRIEGSKTDWCVKMGTTVISEDPMTYQEARARAANAKMENALAQLGSQETPQNQGWWEQTFRGLVNTTNFLIQCDIMGSTHYKPIVGGQDIQKGWFRTPEKVRDHLPDETMEPMILEYQPKR